MAAETVSPAVADDNDDPPGLPDDSTDITDVEQAKAIGLRRLAVRERSVLELRQDLRRRHVADPVIDEVIGRFTEVGLLDDTRFARAWVTERQTGKSVSRSVLSRELAAKGIPREVGAAVLDDVRPEAEVALDLARKKIRAMSGLDRATATRRLAAQLARRGFADSVVRKTVRQVVDDMMMEREVGNIVGDE